jgi:hypothetical protein
MRDGEPCNHKGCLSHITHPCEGCGRIGGKTIVKNFKSKELIEKITYEVSTDAYDVLVNEMIQEGFKCNEILGEFSRDGKFMYIVSFKKDITKLERVIETNLSFDDEGKLQDHQSRIIVVDSWDNYVQEIKKGKYVKRHAEFGGMHGLSIPEEAVVLNFVFDDYHLSCDIQHNQFSDKKIAYRIRG